MLCLMENKLARTYAVLGFYFHLALCFVTINLMHQWHYTAILV